MMGKPGDNPKPITHGAGFDRYIGDQAPEPDYPRGGNGWAPVKRSSADYPVGLPTGNPKAGKTTNPSTNKYSHEVWQRYASSVWFDINPSDTLQKKSARENEDSRHICPLQLTVIRRAIEIWSGPDEVVLSPFAGIGSEGYVALEEGRRFIGAELKESYFNEACRNLKRAEKAHAQVGLFDDVANEDPELDALVAGE
jgi:hypothetical protein